ncbi:MAG TPA: MFS transporter [Sunxiuqinia sp.]|nr:MFS transporter [Sunxiuqinia sp.]
MRSITFQQKIAGLAGVFRSLQYRNYRLFFGGQSLSLIGTWIQRIALPWLVYDLTNSAFLLGLVGFAGQIPLFLMAPFAGVLADRWNRYYMLIATQIAAMLQALALAALYFTGTIQVWQIIALAVFLGCVNAFDVPIRQSFVVDMVDRKEDLGNAIALNSSMFNAARLLGPSIAGLLISFTSEGICFLLNGVSYLFVIASLLLMRIPKRKREVRNQRIFTELKDGFSYAFGFAPIKYIILLLALVSLIGMPYVVLMPVFAREVLHGDSHTFGFLMGATGLGALAGAIYLASRKNVVGLEKVIPIAATCFGVGLIVFSFTRFFGISLLLMTLVGMGMMLQIASSNSIIQTVVDDDMRGRVMSFYLMAIGGIAPFGSLLAGSLATTIGVPHTFLIGGSFILAGAILFSLKCNEIKMLIQPIYEKMGIYSEKEMKVQPEMGRQK